MRLPVLLEALQFNPLVGDDSGNCARVAQRMRACADPGGADLLVTPDSSLAG